jgi:lactate permease
VPGSDGDREDFPGALRSWLPYGLAATILVTTRLEALPFRALLSGTSVRIPALFGTDVVARLDILRNPGVFPLLVIALVSIPLFRIDRSGVRTAWTEAIRTMVAPAVTLVCTVGMVEVMQAGHSGHGWDSMPAVMARTAASSVGVAWPMIAPFVGAFGTFLSGSNTVSNLLFGPVQFWVAEGLGISRTVLVSLQNVGGSFGVVICLFKVSAACSAVGLAGSEGRVVRRMWFPLLLYGLVTGLAGLVVVKWLFPWIF